ncbi:MAG: ABC transporter permease, partial [Anaerolineales bacterium]
AAAGIAALIATPLVYILYRAATGGAETWARLWQTRLVGLLFNTLALMATVTLGTLVVGVTLAWLVERTDLPLRRVWRWLLALPLALPAFIGAVVHVALLRPRGGIIPKFFADTLGWEVQLPSPFGFWGAAFMLTLFMYPYVYLLSAAAFRSLHASLEEAARSFGRGLWRTLWEVTLPVLRPGLAAGALLVALDILAEYGTVALLRYETFSAAIFLQLNGRYDRSAASILSGVLVVLAVAVLVGELRFQGQARYEQLSSGWRPAPPLALRGWRWLAFVFVGFVSLATLFIPLTVLTAWTIQGLADTSYTANVYRFSLQRIGGDLWNSLWSAGLAAGLATTLSIPVAYLSVRDSRLTSRVLSRICQVGYALPGVVVALSLILLVNRFMPFFYGTPLIVVLAYVVRHMPQAVRSSEAALAQVPPSLEEAARSLGRRPMMAILTVTIPLIFPGLLAGAALVFLTSLKELPATLLLRPAGFDTLAVRVWMAAGDGIYTQAAPAALLLILCAAVPLGFLLRRTPYAERKS